MISRYSAEIATAGATAAFGVTILVGALEFGIGWGSAGPQPGAFPFYIGLLIAVASLGTVGQVLAQRRSFHQRFLDGLQATRVIAFFAPIVLFLILAMFLGLYVATALYLFGVMWLQGRYNPLLAAGAALGVAAFFYVVLEKAFQVTILKGPIEAMLGLG